jgi:hypothetical protein
LAIVAALASALIVAGTTCAETSFFRVTPQKYREEFSVKVERIADKDKDKGEFLAFRVTVKRKDVPAVIRRSGLLEMFNSQEDLFKCKDRVSSAKVQPTSRDGELLFSFRVAAKDIAKAKFTYAETEGMEGDGHFYWFYLKDFAPSK